MFLKQNINTFQLTFKKLTTKWTCIYCVRNKGSSESLKKAYSATILAPKTNFPVRSSTSQKEDIQKKGKFSELYNWQRNNLNGPEFVLHDGPPYANGDLHMGHAVNKIIKDIKSRSQVLQGNKVHYVPGWDCHGLPIELKALQKAKKTKENANLSDPVHIRRIAREFALEAVEKQKETFKSWGVMADWDNQCYLTLNKSYVQNQLRKFYELYKLGLVFRAMKPVYWSPSSRTALAEAELEYDPQYKSTEVYVTFPIVKAPKSLQDLTTNRTLYALIWTTTPWSLVANRAIAYNPSLKYTAISVASQNNDKLFIVASNLIEQLTRVLGDVTSVREFDGAELEGVTYSSSLSETSRPCVSGTHVSDARGTGLVHTAPAHGPDDFLLALQHQLDLECNVDEAGRYINLHPTLDGLPVLGEGQSKVIELLGDDVIHKGVYRHSYPLDWRTRQPVLWRACHQWFIDTARLKAGAMETLKRVSILPPSVAEPHRQGFMSQLERRPYWCISRQRAWGVPLPVLYSRETPLVHERIIENLCALMEAHGTDAWWTRDVTELLPPDVALEMGVDVNDVTKGQDIMDIWLDSGLSWSTLGKKADLYSEGVDQFTGWFQTSLLTALPLTNEAPYKSIFVHGFVVDEDKRKMSKSIGNVLDPSTVIIGGKDKKSQPAYGIDTLRWWVASHGTQHSQIIISKKLLDDCQSEVIRIRNIFKYLLGVISDLEPDDFDEKPVLNYLDKYMLKESFDFLTNCQQAYNDYKYNAVTKSLLYFISNKVSGLFCHCVKDRLYCSAKDSNERLAAQLVIHTVLVVLAKAVGPILPHLTEEVWQHHPLGDTPFFFTKSIPLLDVKTVDGDLMDLILDIKRDITVIAKNESLKKMVVNLKVDSVLYNRVCKLNHYDETIGDSVLTEILEVSKVDLEEVNGLKMPWVLEASTSKRSQCLRCRKYNALDCSDKCLRCENVLLNVF